MIWIRKSVCRAATVALCATILLALPTTQASAETTTRTVPADVVIQTKYTADGGNCFTRAYFQWPIQSDELMEPVTGHFFEQGQPGSRQFDYPYSDAPEVVNGAFQTVTFAPPPGFHWGFFSQTSVGSPGGADCSDIEERYVAYYQGVGETADVKVAGSPPVPPVGPSAACVEAQKKESKLESKVKKLKGEKQDAEGKKAEKKAKQKLKEAKQNLNEARANTGEACA